MLFLAYFPGHRIVLCICTYYLSIFENCYFSVPDGKLRHRETKGLFPDRRGHELEQAKRSRIYG